MTIKTTMPVFTHKLYIAYIINYYICNCFVRLKLILKINNSSFTQLLLCTLRVLAIMLRR